MMDLKLIEILLARFCHDIIGPIGAINNGSEFFRDEFPELKSQAIDLIESSGKEAVARVQFYRQAYGALPEGVADLEDMKQLVQDFFTTTKTSIAWQLETGVEISNFHKKLLLNLLVLASGSLIRGGNVNVTLGSKEIGLNVAGDRALLNEKIVEVLKNGAQKDAFDAKTIQAFYTFKLLEEKKLSVAIESDKDIINLTIKL